MRSGVDLQQQITLISQLLGGGGLFLLGVFLITDGLKTAAGAALRRVLIRFTAKPVAAFLSGAGITVLAQSSSATTLATIGFVSAGILTFSQSLGIILGASLGTTSTGWLVALAGLKFGIGKLAFPLVGLGAVLRLVVRGRKAGIALAVAGFGVMFVGIEVLQTGLAPLSTSFSPADLPQGNMAGRVLLVVAGIVLTVFTQSSATAVAMTLTAFHSGMIDLDQGTALVIGASIGTTSTSALVAIGATASVKRTALAHILFSLAAGLLAFLLVPLFIWGVRWAEQHFHLQFGAVILAAFHSGFTLLAGLLFLPKVQAFGDLVERLIPERGPALTRHLDASLVEVPEVAIEAVRRTLREVFAEILATLDRAINQNIRPNAGRLTVTLTALQETRRFLGLIPFSASPADHQNTRASIFHALDHLFRLAIAAKDDFEPDAFGDEPRVQDSKRMVVELLGRVQPVPPGGSAGFADAPLQRLSQTLAERRRRGRASLLEDSARGVIESDQALHALDGLRQLDTIGYHIWRIAHHLNAEVRGRTDAAEAARDVDEFQAD
ncbi:MAG TPA: Na/Pi symporter [Verrucomicrobiota bacterium]|nr:Na/Pi symporter [Verrucomicrobiota bacterium]HNT13942.1 Na/Pi symporter [Verrucomicrobiota bacterium]